MLLLSILLKTFLMLVLHDFHVMLSFALGPREVDVTVCRLNAWPLHMRLVLLCQAVATPADMAVLVLWLCSVAYFI